ncbi:DUF4279 domain-containing protein [Saccharibacillus alkalitolerans]|uniref:DUF4279 domain-containing protein n=1 Tax=Saccharibacillus alkalitolerans TaxID=2705290 RepID=A0ABX0F2G8_9BACL|nr:DUF4279 domain-containing protein [Saccharibacillus alkalitolerans]NGZ74563.1 DUF4279 domain-containing protein [Saccharibacillus alkalitolerans]
MSLENEKRMEAIRKAALREASEQSLAVSRQLLGHQELERENGVPVIAGILEEPGERVAAVYFPVKEERYFFVVYVDTEPEVSLRFAGMDSGSRVYCRIVSETLDLPELLRLIPLEPNKTWQKGTRVSERSEALRSFSGMAIEPDRRLYIEAERKLERLLEVLETRASAFPLSGDSTAHVQIAYYGYKEQMGGVHLSTALMSRLAALGLELDLDLYAGGPDLFEED